MSDVEIIKCPDCTWVHFVVEDGNGLNKCYMCSCEASEMISANETDCPRGSTIQGINRSAYERGVDDTCR